MGNGILTITKVRNWISMVTGMIIYPSIQGKRIIFEYVDPFDGSLVMAVYIGNPDAFKTKYKGLDMFGSDGYPLTNRDDIKIRRLKLIPKYY
jgi:hypothetical protein